MKQFLLNVAVPLSLLIAFGGCVSSTTVENKVPDQAAKSDALYRAQIHTERAAEYYRLDKMAVALEAAEQAISANANYAPAYNMLGIIYMNLRQDAKAQRSESTV